jgi:ketosteroid isomerase-like protein
MSEPPKFELSDIRITAGSDVAFATARGECLGPDDSGKPAELEFRLTIGLRKIDGDWVVEHEHHSVPAP